VYSKLKLKQFNNTSIIYSMSSLQQPMQQPNITDFNNLLQEASNSILCGPECQRTNTKNKLYQNYLDAKSNLENGPNIVNERAKQYYMYSEGPIGYNNYINQDLEQQLNVIDNNLIEKFNNNLNQAKTLLLTFVISFIVLIGGYFGIKYAGKNNLFERVIQKGGVNGAFENDFLDNLTYEDNDVDFDIMDE